MTAAANDITIEQGEDWTPRWQLKWAASGNAYDLTGYTAKLQIRANYYSTAIMFELNTSNGGITLGGTNGTIQLNLTAAQSIALFPTGAPAPNPVNRTSAQRPVTQVGEYDLRLISGAGKNWPIAGGRVFVVPNVTRT